MTTLINHHMPLPLSLAKVSQVVVTYSDIKTLELGKPNESKFYCHENHLPYIIIIIPTVHAVDIFTTACS